ncbi:solute carrier family 35 member G2-like [Branchiostoma floridae x Branchiostoma japonicum]
MDSRNIVKAGEGVIFALVAAVGFSAFPSLARLAANSGVPDLQVVLVDELANAVVFLPVALFCRTPLKCETQKQTFSLIGTGVLRVFSTTVNVLSFLYIPPAATIAISAGTGPFFSAVLSRLALKEATGWINIVGMVVQVTGVGLVVGGTHLRTTVSNHAKNLTEQVNTNASILSPVIIQDTVSSEYIIGIVLAFLGTLGLVTSNVMSRAFLQKVPQLMVLVYMESLGSLFVFPAMYIFNTPKWNLDISVVGILVGQGVIYTISIACLYRSLALENASTVAILRGLSVALAYAFQHFILDLVALLTEYIGATITAVSIVFVGGFKWYKTYHSDQSNSEETSNAKQTAILPTDTFVKSKVTYTDIPLQTELITMV